MVTAKDPVGQTHHFESRFLIDASGRRNLTGNQEALREMDSELKKVAIFGHFLGVKLDEGEPGGDTIITRLANKWFWLIPVSATKTSVGLVLDREEFQRSQGGAAEVFRSCLDLSPGMQSRMRDAKPLGQIQTTSDFSYMNRRLVGPRLVRVGDAAGFIDPIFSTGVYLAMWSGKHAAQAIAASLQTGDSGTRRLLVYERRVRRSMRFYRGMVEGFYTTPFMELFMNPRHGLSLPSAINAMLAGNLENTWALRWRTWLFFLFVRIQSTFPLVPRISFTGDRPRSRDLSAGARKP